jgi:hypothetical protein
VLLQRVNRSNPEKIFIIAKNSYSSAMTSGQAVIWDFATDADGVGVTRPTARATNAGVAIAGVAAETIAVGDYGLFQVYGYHSGVRQRASTSAGDLLVPGAPIGLNAAGSVFCLEALSTAANVVLVHPCGFSLTSSAVWTTVAAAAFLKCL